ncbi:protein daughter of sevenless [Anopheles cruzii]|uniref:protein daughter of sevenless n=1 Tax=Anopheles cruzii TaxID=68878 RepID=UPI0022EC54DE|nr:protein daughter of sevenless [Anopheles cruzii]
MFDVKTPTRTYYLAADTEDDMRGWVNCICQVCNLQETQTVDDRPYYNIGAINMMNDAVNMAVETRPPAKANGGGPSTTETDISNETETTMLNHSVPAGAADTAADQQVPMQGRAFSNNNNPYGTYQNEEMMGMRSAHGDYTNRETIICEAKLNLSHQQPSASNIIAPPEAYSNLDVIERSQSLRGKPGTSAAANGNGAGTTTSATTGSPLVNHMRTQSLNIEQRGTKRIPENLKLTDRSPSSAFDSGPEQPSPALSTSSGPYIPISECYSGSPVTPLNSLDPRFYETPRSHTNVGFNLVSNEQPYSPKRSNVGGGQAGGHQGPSSLVMTAVGGQQKVVIPGSGKSSPSDSESVFTDDEWTAPAGSSNGVGAGAGGAGGGSGTGASRGAGNGGTIDRNARPSDSSIENDAVGWTYVQRFSKVPNSSEDKPQQQHSDPKVTGNGPAGAPPRPPKRASMNLEGIEKTKDLIASDTENVSPAIIGPKDASSCIDEFYDIPRSHQHPYTGSSMHLPDGDLLSPLSHCDLVASSTPNLIGEFTTGGGGTLGRGGPRPHCYTNAAPTKVEGNVFRFDFSEQPDAPIINRRLKPRSSIDITKSIESITQGVKQLGGPATVPAAPPATPVAIVGQQPSVPTVKSPPTIDRTRKPATPKIGTNSMRRKGGPVALNLASNQSSESTYGNTQETNASAALLVNVSPRAPGKNEDRLQYLDLDHSNSPQKSSTATSSGPYSLTGLTGIGYGGVPANHQHHHGSAAAPKTGKSEPGGAGGSGANVPTVPGAVGSGSRPGIVDVPAPITNRTPYTTVDFVKTDAFNRIRADSELARQKDQAS